ncbi:GerMN domain-containing protein [Patescibacteria group bacterium]|nr:GerMN domain-containing protein [Patescibacteria group bacterium]
MMQSRERLGLFLGGLVLVIIVLVAIWSTMPTSPAEAPSTATTTATGTQPGTMIPATTTTGSVTGSSTTSTDGKDALIAQVRSVSTTQDLPFIDLPGRRDGALCGTGDFICISDEYKDRTVSNPLTVTGTAIVYEGRVNWKLLVGTGSTKELASGVVQAEKSPEGVPSPFSIRAFFPPSMANASGAMTLILSETSLKDGSEIHALRVPVRLTGDTSSITVFTTTSETAKDCTRVQPVTVRIPRTVYPIEASLQRLIELRTVEGNQDISAIPDGTKLLSLSVKDGIATAVFSRELDQSIGGSCRVTAIREQIEQTLMQFPQIKKVAIIAEGKTADTTLQP